MTRDVENKQVEDEMFLVDDDDENASGVSKYLLFKLGDEEYGVDISKVTGIEELHKVTHIPDMPSFMKGVINLRGRVIPILDLRLRFGMEERPYDDRTCIIITTIKSLSVGLVVDTVAVVIDLDSASVDPPPSFKSDSGKEKYIHGLARVDEDVKILVDVDRIIHEDDIRALKEGLKNGGDE